MLLKREKWQECPTCNRREKIISKAVYGCDNCKKEFTEHNLEVKVFHQKTDDVEHLQFCCWKCVLEFLSKIKTNNFVDLPPYSNISIVLW